MRWIALALLLLSSNAWADRWEPPRPGAAPPVPDRSFLVTASLEIAGQDGNFVKQIYGREDFVAFGLHGTWLFEERFGFGLGAGLLIRQADGVAPAGVDVPQVTLWQIPVQVEGVLRLSLWRDQIPVPYFRGGMTGLVWTELGGDTEPVGVKWGPHAAGGVQFRLPFPEIQFEGRISGDPLLDDIYAHVEGWVRSSSSFGAPGLDLSAAGFAAGITLLM